MHFRLFRYFFTPPPSLFISGMCKLKSILVATIPPFYHEVSAYFHGFDRFFQFYLDGKTHAKSRNFWKWKLLFIKMIY